VTGFGWLGVALAAKRLELLRELLPNGATIGMLVNPASPDSDFEMRDIQDAARILGRQIHILTASSDADFDGVFATLVKQQVGALIVAADAYFSGRRGRIVALAARHGVAAIYDRREFPDAGGLISYGHHRADAYRFSAGSVAPLVQRLHDLGGIECYNVVIEYRWAPGGNERFIVDVAGRMRSCSKGI
jgi:ABC-type uncharacterized transport system substrate-binding protein